MASAPTSTISRQCCWLHLSNFLHRAACVAHLRYPVISKKQDVRCDPHVFVAEPQRMERCRVAAAVEAFQEKVQIRVAAVEIPQHHHWGLDVQHGVCVSAQSLRTGATQGPDAVVQRLYFVMLPPER